MLTKDNILAKLSELKPVLYREFAVKEIGLFGSFSDESFSPESDIDLLVELERPIGWKFFTLEIFLEQKLGRKIDLVTKNALKDQLKDHILKEVKIIWDVAKNYLPANKIQIEEILQKEH
jgi:predicted nucleotidyltransferase